MSVEQDTRTIEPSGEFPGERVRYGELPDPEPEPLPVLNPEPEPLPVLNPEPPRHAVVEAEPVEAAPARPEVERLDPQPIVLVLESGLEFDLEPLKLRQFLRLLRIVTRGAADVLDQTQIDFEDPDAFVQTFLGMVLFSIPEAEEESVDFIKSMVRPKNLIGDPKQDLELVRALSSELDNPELTDTITIIQAVIERESEDLRALGKRLSAMFKVAQKVGATKDKPTPAVI